MGQLYTGIHEKIALKARDEFLLDTFIETGTYRGESAVWAKDYFEKVVTIEYSQNLYQKAEELIDNAPNILLILGDSRQYLREVCEANSNRSVLFWLDSHPMKDADDKDPYGSPLLDEIRIINDAFFGPHIIMVDDYFAIQHNNWAKSEDVIRLLIDSMRHDRQIRIMDDIYFAAPRIPEDFEEWKK